MNSVTYYTQTPYGPRPIRDPYRTPLCAKVNRKAPLRSSRSRESKSKSKSPQKYPTSYDGAHMLSDEFNSAKKEKICIGSRRNYSQESIQQFNVITESSVKGSEKKLIPILSPHKPGIMKNKNEKRVSYDPEIDQQKEQRDYYKSNSNDFRNSMYNTVKNYSSNQYWTKDIDSIKVIESEPPEECNHAQTQDCRIKDENEPFCGPTKHMRTKSSVLRYKRDNKYQIAPQVDDEQVNAFNTLRETDRYNRNIYTERENETNDLVNGYESNQTQRTSRCLRNQFNRKAKRAQCGNGIKTSKNSLERLNPDGEFKTSKLTKVQCITLYPIIKIIMEQVSLSRELEHYRLNLSHTEDFNLPDLYKAFSISKDCTLAKYEFTKGCQIFGVTPKSKEIIYDIFDRYTKEDNKHRLTFQQFSEIFLPHDQKHATEVYQRIPIKSRGMPKDKVKMFKQVTSKCVTDLISKLIKAEQQLKKLQREAQAKCDDVKSLFLLLSCAKDIEFKFYEKSKECTEHNFNPNKNETTKCNCKDKTKDSKDPQNYILKEHMLTRLRQFGMKVDQDDVSLLFLLYDRDKKHKISFADFVRQLLGIE